MTEETRATVTGPDSPEMRRLMISISHEGPWDRLSGWLLGYDRRTGRLRFEVRDGSLRERLAVFCEARDVAWRNRWAARHPRQPPARWKRTEAGQ
jgi:hypothetical protein